MPRQKRMMRERVSIQCSDYLWARLLDEITDDTEGEMQRSPDPEVRAQYDARASFDFLLEGFNDVAPETFDLALEAFIEENPGQRPSWWWGLLSPNPPDGGAAGYSALRFGKPPSNAPALPGESQFAYLKRTKLLTKGEARRLKRGKTHRE